ncbi:glycerol-3-phosphate 1-O-acyltransferase PlsY [Anaerobacillus sp. MEB173]|uniref:glycerol-3-phosphate 1-O-acyltransferase PlsY n=1 Tax=Anaerobacillus sp. MEB173 TaxID=3383345 RepID=UPI003F8DBD5D
MGLVLSIIIAYLLGSISFSYIIAKKIKKVDIRQHGSGNAGATNTLRVLGVGPAITVLLLDAGKGVAAVFIAYWITGSQFVSSSSILVETGMIAASAGLAAIIGHNWPIYYGFRGGKGVATTIGVVASLTFFPALISGIITIIIIATTRYVSLGSLAFMTLTPILSVTLFDHYPIGYFYLLCIVALLSYWRHRSNIQRLLTGKESKIGEKKTV